MDFLSGNVGMPVPQQPGQAAPTQQQQQPQVGGAMPIVGVDKDGYWTLNGERVLTQTQLNGSYSEKTQRIKGLEAQLSESQQAASAYLKELTLFKQKDVARAAGVPEGAMDYALWGANQAAATGKDFTTALKEFMQANPVVFGTPQGAGQQVQQPAPGVQQSPSQTGFVLPTAQTSAQPIQMQQPVQQPVQQQVQQPTQQHQVGFVQPPMQQSMQPNGMQMTMIPGQQASQTAGLVSSGVAGFLGSMPVGSVSDDEEADRFLASKGIKLPEGV